MGKYIRLIKEYSKNEYKNITREASGKLKYPFIVPGRAYAMQLWDWDSWLTDIAIRQIFCDNNDSCADYERYEKGCILNFIDHTDKEGRMPILISSSGGGELIGENTNMHKPCLAQHLAFIMQQTDNKTDWFIQCFDKVELFIKNYIKNQKHTETGLFFWLDDLAIGVDNEPTTFYRPKKSSAAIYLNCLMYKELCAMEYICGVIGKDSQVYRKEAEELKAAINEYLWDERNGFYYSADLNLVPMDKNNWLHGGMPRHWNSLIQKIDVWCGFMAMWAGIATKEQAERIVKENMLNEKTFYAPYGIRSLSKCEKMYRVIASGNPSCWTGPVWINANYMCFKGLIRYGYTDEAADIAKKTIELLGRDIEQNGEMHEYYDPDSGKGVANLGFQSWNLLVNNMIAWLEERKTINEF